jgi:transcriptional regulator
MYAPAHFAEKDPIALAAFLRRRPLATIVVNGPDGPVAAHAPLASQFSEDGRVSCLVGHVARANPFWKAAQGASALAIFAGPDAYVSPSHYPSKTEHGRVVPTWNYARIEARGPITLVEDAAGLRDIVETLTDMMEGARDAPWSVSDAPEDYVAAMLKAIVGFRMTITSLEGAFKLNQNKNAADREGVRRGLAGGGADDVAALMREREET